MPNQQRKSKKQQYEVEKVLDKRVDGLIVYYKVKWVGYRTPTWERAANLASCKEVVGKFEQEHAKRAQKQEEGSNGVQHQEPTESTPIVNGTTGYYVGPGYVSPQVTRIIKRELPRGLTPARIIGSSKSETGELFFALEFEPEGRRQNGHGENGPQEVVAEDDDKPVELIYGTTLKQHCPLLLIEFYESRAVFLST